MIKLLNLVSMVIFNGKLDMNICLISGDVKDFDGVFEDTASPKQKPPHPYWMERPGYQLIISRSIADLRKKASQPLSPHRSFRTWCRNLHAPAYGFCGSPLPPRDKARA